jgi:hypothetical protein
MVPQVDSPMRLSHSFGTATGRQTGCRISLEQPLLRNFQAMHHAGLKPLPRHNQKALGSRRLFQLVVAVSPEQVAGHRAIQPSAWIAGSIRSRAALTCSLSP